MRLRTAAAVAATCTLPDALHITVAPMMQPQKIISSLSAFHATQRDKPLFQKKEEGKRRCVPSELSVQFGLAASNVLAEQRTSAAAANAISIVLRRWKGLRRLRIASGKRMGLLRYSFFSFLPFYARFCIKFFCAKTQKSACTVSWSAYSHSPDRF